MRQYEDEVNTVSKQATLYIRNPTFVFRLSQDCSGLISLVRIRVRGFRGFMKRPFILFAHISFQT